MKIVSGMLSIILLISFTVLAVKIMRNQFCHSQSQHLLVMNIIGDHLGEVSKPTLAIFLARQQCLGLYRKIKENQFQYIHSATLKHRLGLKLNESI